MAYTVEDGTGLSAANAYIDVTFADSYHVDRGHTAWAFSDADNMWPITLVRKQEAIVRATDYIDQMFGARFRGIEATDDQALSWPRSNAYSGRGTLLTLVPSALKKAAAEYALRALLYGELAPDPPPTSARQSFCAGSEQTEFGDGSGKLSLAREKVGPIETELRFKGESSSAATRGYHRPTLPVADALLRTLLTAKTNRIVRG